MVISSNESSIVSNTETSNDNLDPCSDQEADTKIFVYARHATVDGSKTLIINANDTDKVVASLQDEGLENNLLWP